MFASFMMANAKDINDYRLDERPILAESKIDTLKIGVPAEIRMFEGNAFDFKINVIDDEFIEKHLIYEIVNNSLCIKLDHNYYDLETIDNKKIKIEIMTPKDLSIITGNRNLSISSYHKKTMKKSNNENN